MTGAILDERRNRIQSEPISCPLHAAPIASTKNEIDCVQLQHDVSSSLESSLLIARWMSEFLFRPDLKSRNYGFQCPKLDTRLKCAHNKIETCLRTNTSLATLNLSIWQLGLLHSIWKCSRGQVVWLPGLEKIGHNSSVEEEIVIILQKADEARSVVRCGSNYRHHICALEVWLGHLVVLAVAECEWL